MQNRRRKSVRPEQRRRGFLAPLMAFALLVIMAAGALSLDYVWLQNAERELLTAAEASALAAARELATDELLQEKPEMEPVIQQARRTAGQIAYRNQVVARPVVLDVSSNGDLHFGRYVYQEQLEDYIFIETCNRPTTVRVTTHRNRSRNNPVALLAAGVTRQPWGDVSALAHASIDNRVVGVRPAGTAAMPTLPLAICRTDSTGQCTQTWEQQIAGRQGEDRFSWDAKAGKTVERADGLVEMVLRGKRRTNLDGIANVELIELGNINKCETLTRQILQGYRKADVEQLEGGALWDDRAQQLRGYSIFDDQTINELTDVVGQCRICCLYESKQPLNRLDKVSLDVTGLAVVRVLAVDWIDGDWFEMRIQPAVLATRTAILADELPHNADDEPHRNPYLYKLHLVR